MRPALRCLVLSTALVFITMSTAQSSIGTCHIFCWGPMFSGYNVFLQTSYEQCCSITSNFCSPGTVLFGKPVYNGTICPS